MFEKEIKDHHCVMNYSHCKDLVLQYKVDENKLKIFDVDWDLWEEYEINFCPICGSDLRI